MMTATKVKPWWMTDEYAGDYPVPDQLGVADVGPKGLALVRAWPDGRTDPGWGLVGKDGGEGFMPRYGRGEFNERRVLYGYGRDRWAFAFVMRALQMVVIDIDGKNGGLEHANRLGLLPPTLAETSKSGNGFHLWYRTDEVWDDVTGFSTLNDKIGVEQGVDLRAVGCVYHHKQQRWNSRVPVLLPPWLATLFKRHDQQVGAAHQRISKILDSEDEMEVLMMQDELLADLAKPIPQGKRNVSLFAIGSQMKAAGIADWEAKVTARATEVGLDSVETAKLVANVAKYGTTTP